MVVNVGAGAGAYEPTDRELVAVEPSTVMTAQRPPGPTRVVEAVAERLPFGDGEFEASMAVLSDHHWGDRRQGLRELRRVARRRVVLFNADPGENARFWMTTEYLPGFVELIEPGYRIAGAWESRAADDPRRPRAARGPDPPRLRRRLLRRVLAAAGGVPGPGSPRRHLGVRAAPDQHVTRGLAALADDLRSGAWRERHHDLLGLDELHLGYYVVVAELSG